MKVILLADVKNLGKKLEVKEVNAGYARNFLLPHKLAQVATSEALAQLEAQRAAQREEAEMKLKQIQAEVARLDGEEVEILAKVTEGDKLYAAISAAEIGKALKEKSFAIAKEQIKISSPLKNLGEYEVIVAFDHGLEAKIKVIVKEQQKTD